MKNFFLRFVFFIVILLGCKTNNGNKNRNPVIVKLLPKTTIDSSKQNNNSGFNYDLKNPDRTWKLPSELAEVSGNTWIDKDHLILIEDTHPILYLIKIDDRNAVLEKTIAFEKDKKDMFDIEDVTIANGVVYALWSHGILFEIANWNSKPDVKKISTSLSKENNTEGLCYDPLTNKLLIACKDKSGLTNEKNLPKQYINLILVLKN